MAGTTSNGLSLINAATISFANYEESIPTGYVLVVAQQLFHPSVKTYNGKDHANVVDGLLFRLADIKLGKRAAHFEKEIALSTLTFTAWGLADEIGDIPVKTNAEGLERPTTNAMVTNFITRKHRWGEIKTGEKNARNQELALCYLDNEFMAYEIGKRRVYVYPSYSSTDGGHTYNVDNDGLNCRRNLRSMPDLTAIEIPQEWIDMAKAIVKPEYGPDAIAASKKTYAKFNK